MRISWRRGIEGVDCRRCDTHLAFFSEDYDTPHMAKTNVNEYEDGIEIFSVIFSTNSLRGGLVFGTTAL